MASGDVSRFGGAKGGRPKNDTPSQPAPTPQMAASGISVPGRNNSEDCNKGGCGKPATHVLIARDSSGDTDSAALCLEHSKSVARKAKSGGNKVAVTRLNEKTQALHRDLSGATHMRDLAEEGLARRGIPGNDALVGRSEIKPGQRTGRPREVFSDPRARHLQAVRKRRSDAELEANVGESLREIHNGSYIGLPPSTDEGGSTEAGRSYSEFLGSLAERASQKGNRTNSVRLGAVPHLDDADYREHLRGSGVQVEGLNSEHLESLRPLFPGAPASRMRDTPYNFNNPRSGKKNRV
jgi:hypothetical protein